MYYSIISTVDDSITLNTHTHTRYVTHPQVTPVLEVSPVSIGGVTVRHATLHNVGHFRALGLALGDTVSVTRAGDVIPYVSMQCSGSARSVESSTALF
jgi:NAD-dependent DNA ligase